MNANNLKKDHRGRWRSHKVIFLSKSLLQPWLTFLKKTFVLILIINCFYPFRCGNIYELLFLPLRNSNLPRTRIMWGYFGFTSKQKVIYICLLDLVGIKMPLFYTRNLNIYLMVFLSLVRSQNNIKLDLVHIFSTIGLLSQTSFFQDNNFLRTCKSIYKIV